MYEVNARLVREKLFNSGLTAKAFAQKAGINSLTISRLSKDGAKAQAKVIGKLAKACGVEGEQLILKG